jgi:hypothetical protein
MPDSVPQLLPLLAVAKALCVSPHHPSLGEAGQAETRSALPSVAISS